MNVELGVKGDSIRPFWASARLRSSSVVAPPTIGETCARIGLKARSSNVQLGDAAMVSDGRRTLIPCVVARIVSAFDLEYVLKKIQSS